MTILNLCLPFSGSGSVRSLGVPASQEEQRPVSAENLLPEPSIASITTSSAAVKLNSVLHPSGRHLTRQQTFPPLHPSCHPATRYRHSTAGAEVLHEASDSSDAASSSSSCHSESRELMPTKREPPSEPERERTKIAKLEGKENRAPTDKQRKSIQVSIFFYIKIENFPTIKINQWYFSKLLKRLIKNF
jgi:hypothetical protein